MTDAGVIAFYRNQARLMWEWRATRLAILRRTLISYVCAVAALAIAAEVLPGFAIRDLGELLLAALLFDALSATSRLFFLWILAPLPIAVVQTASIAFQAVVLIVLRDVIPGFRVANASSALVAAVVIAVAIAALSEVTRAADDDSYYGTLVRQLVARNANAPRTELPGLLIVQIDGLSLPVLEAQIRAGRMPVIARLIRSGTHSVDPWSVLLPSVTPASQAGILHGRNDDVPGFRWFEKESQHLFVADHPADAKVILQRHSDGNGLLTGGASIGNLLTGDARESFLTMATIAQDTRRLHGFFVNTVNYLRLGVLMLGEFGKELYQAERQRSGGVVPRLHRGFAYGVERAIANVILRVLSTSLVIEQLYDAAPIVYVDYTGYDTIAHHSGPERQEAADALAGIDRSIGSLRKAIRDAPRPYEIVILSDHGQSLGVTFRQAFGEPLETTVATLMGGSPKTLGATGPGERRARAMSQVQGPALVVTASGNLAHVYLADKPGRLSRETIERLHPGLIAGLAAHPGVELLMVASDTDGPTLISGSRTVRLNEADADTAVLRSLGRTALPALLRLHGFSNTGDLVLLGRFDPDSREIVSFEELVGSHGGLGGWQTQAFVLHPFDWAIGDAVIGAPALHDVLAGWRRELQPVPASS